MRFDCLCISRADPRLKKYGMSLHKTNRIFHTNFMKTTSKNISPALVTGAAVVACIIWGTPFKLLKIFYNELQITTEAFGNAYNGQMLLAVSLRFFMAGWMTLLFAKFTHNRIFTLKKTQWLHVAVMGLISTTISYFFFNIGNVNISSSANASLLGQSGIFFGVILSAVIYKEEHFTWQKAGALLLGFAGLFISQLKPGASIGESFAAVSFHGEGFMLVHGVIFAISTMLGKAFQKDLNSFVMTGWNLVLGSAGLAILGLLMGGRFGAIHFTPISVLLLLILAVASAIPFSIWYWCTGFMEIGRLSVFKFLIPVSSSIIAVLFGEPFTWFLGIGLLLVCAAIILINL